MDASMLKVKRLEVFCELLTEFSTEHIKCFNVLPTKLNLWIVYPTSMRFGV